MFSTVTDGEERNERERDREWDELDDDAGRRAEENR